MKTPTEKIEANLHAKGVDVVPDQEGDADTRDADQTLVALGQPLTWDIGHVRAPYLWSSISAGRSLEDLP